MTRIRLALMLYFFIVAHKATCQTLWKAFSKSMKTWYRTCWCWRDFSQRMLRLKSYSVVLLSVLKFACSSAMIFSALMLQSVQYDLQHDFAWVTDEADPSVVLTLLQVAFLGRCGD